MKDYLKQAKGFGVIEIVVVVAVVAILGVGGYLYYQSTQKSSNGLTAQEQAELKAACKVEIADELLCSVFTNWSSVSQEPATYTATSTDANGDTTTMTVKTSGDNYHSVINSGDQAIESMRIDSTSYMKMDGIWYKQTLSSETPDTSETDGNPSSELDSIVSEDKASTVEYKNLGQDACGTATCIKYKVKDSEDTATTNYFWVDPSNQKLMKIEMTNTDGSSTVMVYTYGAVTIEAPADAKDYSEMLGM